MPDGHCRFRFVLPGRGILVLLDNATLFDTSLLAGEGAEVVELCATYFTVLVDGNRVDEGRFDGEDTLNADVVAHLADGETLLHTFTGDADDNTAVLLDTFLVTFLDAVSYGDGVTGAEIGMLLAGSEGFFGNFNQIHCVNDLEC